MAKTFESYVIRSILVNNQFNIKDVTEIHEIRTMIFERNLYLAITDLIRNKQTELIKTVPDHPTRTFEYLTVMEFTDQDRKKYIVTVYDQDELWQDPQVIDIFSQ
jgi:hypothetical protein